MIAKWDETLKLGQYRRYQSWDSLGEYRLGRKRTVEEMGFEYLRKKRGWKFRDGWVKYRRRSDMMSNVTYIRWETVPQNGCIMTERYSRNFRMRGERKTTKGVQRRRPSRTMWREWKKRAEVKMLSSFERCISDRENLVGLLDSLIYMW